MIKSSFLGRIGKDGATVKEGKNGKKYLQMDVATDIRSNGETKPMWVRVKSNNPQHLGNLVQYLTKGKLVEITGTQSMPNAWIGTKDGQAHAQVVIVANTIEFVRVVGKKDNAEENTEGKEKVVEQREVQNIPDTTAENTPFPPQAPEENTEDLPF